MTQTPAHAPTLTATATTGTGGPVTDTSPKPAPETSTQTAAPAGTNTRQQQASPMRGLVFGIILVMIFYPTCRDMIGNAVLGFIGAVLGTFIAMFIHGVATTRRY